MEEIYDSYEGEDTVIGYKYRCRRYAPRMIYGAGTGFKNWEHPEVKGDHWCGEYQKEESCEWNYQNE